VPFFFPPTSFLRSPPVLGRSLSPSTIVLAQLVRELFFSLVQFSRFAPPLHSMKSGPSPLAKLFPFPSSCFSILPPPQCILRTLLYPFRHVAVGVALSGHIPFPTFFKFDERPAPAPVRVSFCFFSPSFLFHTHKKVPLLFLEGVLAQADFFSLVSQSLKSLRRPTRKRFLFTCSPRDPPPQPGPISFFSPPANLPLRWRAPFLFLHWRQPKIEVVCAFHPSPPCVVQDRVFAEFLLLKGLIFQPVMPSLCPPR